MVTNSVLPETLNPSISIPQAIPKSEPSISSVVSNPESEKDVKKTPAVKLELLENCVRIDLGQGYTKLIEYQDFSAAISKLTGDRIASVKEKVSYSLPSNTFWFACSDTVLEVSCYYPGAIRNVNYLGDVQLRVTPNIIISHNLQLSKSGCNHSVAYFLATDLPLSRLNRKFYTKPVYSDRVFLLPFPNMYDNGTMCVGSNQLPKQFPKGDVRGLQAYFDMIFNSPFNNDLGVRGVSRNSTFGSVNSWFRHLTDLAKANAEFPYKELEGFTPLKIAG